MKRLIVVKRGQRKKLTEINDSAIQMGKNVGQVNHGIERNIPKL